MSSAYIAQLNYASVQVNRYLAVTLILFGIIGNILSCLVFANRTLRANPCVIYFLIASISNIISLISGIPPRLLSNWNIYPDHTETISSLCRSRIMVLLTSRNISSWLLVFATIDRYLISSPKINIRQMSNIKQAYRCIIIICLISIILWSESIYCFDANVIGTPIKCYAKSEICRIINDLSQSFLTTIIPSTVMLIFGLYTIKNIKQGRRIHQITINNTNTNTNTNTTNNNPNGRKKTEQNLTRMLFFQVIVLTIFNMPQAIQKFYLTATFYQIKSSQRVALENLIFNIVLLFTYIPNCMPFYLYILTSSLFRKTFYQLNRNILRCI